MGKQWKQWEMYSFWRGGSKITVDGDCSHEIKRCLLLGRKAMTNLDSILKSRDITLPTKVHLVKAIVFPVVMYGCESCTIKKAEHWRIDTFFFFNKVSHWLNLTACGILVPQPGIKPEPPALEAQSSNHGATREVPELMLLNYGVGENSWESLRLQGDPTSPS